MGIEEIVTNRARRELGDRRHHPLESRSLDPPEDAVDGGRGVPRLDRLPARLAAFDEAVEDSVDLLIGEADVALVGLARPEAGRRGLAADGRRWQSES